MVGAALLARNANEKGLKVKPWVKTSLAPGSKVVTDYLEKAQLDDDLEALGFYTVGGGGAFLERARQLEADNVRDQHRDRLAEHRGFCLDATDAPAEHADAVNHRRMRIGANDRIRIRLSRVACLVVEYDATEILQVDLVDDARVGRNHAEVFERALAPAKERVALPVAVEFNLVI